MDDRKQASYNKIVFLYVLPLCVIGLLINVLGARLASALSLPLYLDCVGSALTAALGGYLPGIIVGFFTNIINGVFDYTTTYYGALTVLISVCSAWFARKKYYEKPARLPLVVLTFAIIGGGLGSVLTWVLYGFDFGTGISAPLAHRIYTAGVMNEFWSQFSADMLLDLLDKAITVLLVALTLKLLPESFKERFTASGWLQAPLSKKTQVAAERKKARLMSLRGKIVLMVGAACVMVAAAVTAISYTHYQDSAIAEKTSLADGLATAAVHFVDADRVDEFIREGRAAQGYAETMDHLAALRDTSDDIAYVYVYRIEPDGCHVVFDPDTEDTPGAEPGEIIPFDDAFQAYLPALLAGDPIEPVDSDESYGWLRSVYKPVRDKNGVCRCYAAVDVDLSSVRLDGYQFLARVVSLFLGFFIVVLAAALWLAEYNIVLPINTLALTTGRFDFKTEDSREQSVQKVKQLDIHTGDEIENLYGTVVKTAETMADSISQVEKQNKIINDLQSGLILVMADMVESRDKCTGDHVRKTAAYVDIILQQLKQDGIYADQLTDKFIQDVHAAAPLHDLGKIKVPDGVLNKPTRLTPEEYELIKRHTVDGSEIISKVAETVEHSNSAYLNEAKNLALYHHEKWDGTGYPNGVSGEDIPLSARIMAVADVFDALTSRRSYKAPFSYERAMSIIEEGSGTHFDAKVVAAFQRAKEKTIKVMEENYSI